jgi:hypothetical protein
MLPFISKSTTRDNVTTMATNYRNSVNMTHQIVRDACTRNNNIRQPALSRDSILPYTTDKEYNAAIRLVKKKKDALDVHLRVLETIVRTLRNDADNDGDIGKRFIAEVGDDYEVLKQKNTDIFRHITDDDIPCQETFAESRYLFSII